MTHVNFDPDSINWSAYLEVQEGRGRYFEGMRQQRGYGMMQTIGKFLLPVIKNFALSAGEEGVTTGINVLKDLAEGKDLKNSFESHGRQGLGKLKEKLHQCGKGKARKARKSRDPFTNLV